MRRTASIALSLALLVSAIVPISARAAITATCRGKAATIKGSAGADQIRGTNGNDVIAGLGGNDVINGRGGDDLMCGDAGNDRFVAGDGSDSLDGGAGSDTITFAGLDNVAYVDLGSGGGPGSTNTVEILRSIENVIGSDNDDVFSGRPGANSIQGGAGDDLFIFHPSDSGDDSWDAGTGTDRADYLRAAGGVAVDLAAGSATVEGTGTGTDTIAGFEDVTGSFFADQITGDDGPNELDGSSGWAPDVISGAGGNDLITGSYGAVTLDGGAGDDEVLGGSFPGATINGGEGNDYLGARRGTSHTVGTYENPWYPGTNTYNGGPGNDEMFGSDINNEMFGGPGGDGISAFGGDDFIDGGDDIDGAGGGYGLDTCVNVEVAGRCDSEDGDEFEPGPAVTEAPSADVSSTIRQAAKRDNGDRIFAVTVTNEGPATVPARVYALFSGEVLTFDDSLYCNRFLYTTTELTCATDNLAPGQSKTFRIKVRGATNDSVHAVAAFGEYVSFEGLYLDPDPDNNTDRLGALAVCPLDEPPLPEIDLTARDAKEVARDLRGDLSLAEWIEKLQQAIAEVEADTAENPDHQTENDALLTELNALLDAAQAQRQSTTTTRRPMQEVSDVQAELLESARCWALDQARENLLDYMAEKTSDDHVELFRKLRVLKTLLNGEDVGESDKKEFLDDAIKDLVSRLAADEVDEETTDRKKAKYVAVVTNSYNILKDALSGELGDNKYDRMKDALTSASGIFASSDTTEFVELMFKLRKVIAGEASEKEQYDILKEVVANLADRLTTHLFGTALLSTPQARAAMLGFEIGYALGDRIAKDLELIFEGALVDDCTQTLAAAQGGSGTIDVDYDQATIATVTNELLWHAGWHCVIITEGYDLSNAGGIVQATKPADYTFRQAVVWQITTKGRDVVYWDPACAVGGGCNFKSD